MNIKEALEWSKAHEGQAVERTNPGEHGFLGWFRWDTEEWVYELSFSDLTAEDWEPLVR